MKTRQDVLKLVFTLAETYGKDLPETRAKLFTESVADVLIGKYVTEAYKRITHNCEYFPTPKQIIDLFDAKALLGDKAEQFIDAMIAGFTGPEQDWAGLGRDGYYLAKNVLGVTRAKFRTPGFDPEKKRRTWKGKLLRHWEGASDNLALPEPRKRIGHRSGLSKMPAKLDKDDPWWVK